MCIRDSATLGDLLCFLYKLRDGRKFRAEKFTHLRDVVNLPLVLEQQSHDIGVTLELHRPVGDQLKLLFVAIFYEELIL